MVQVLNPEYTLRSEYDSVPFHWITALKACCLAKIVQLGIEAEMLFCAPTALLFMPKDLEQIIDGFLRRVVGGEVPRLSLIGFREEEREKFPRSWEVVMSQWNPYKDEVRGMQAQLDAWPVAQWTFDLESWETKNNWLTKNELPTISISSQLRAYQ